MWPIDDQFNLLPAQTINKLAVRAVVNCNLVSSRHGLTLSPAEAREIVEARDAALSRYGRIELAGGVINKLIIKFCDSPFLQQADYAATLNDLLETFYYFKNETLGEISDDELIALMRKYFDQECQGSLELLQNRELESLARQIRYRPHPRQPAEPAYYAAEPLYFHLLLQEALGHNLITEAEFARIQGQGLRLLAEQVELFTGGAGSSVRIETAQNILQSIFYTVSMFLKSFPDPRISITELTRQPLAELYRQGRNLLESRLREAKQILRAVQDNQLITNNQAYNDTIQKGLPMFFAAYNPDFAAHDTPGSIDYPLTLDDYPLNIGDYPLSPAYPGCQERTELVGIEYVWRYVQVLWWENRFCQEFAAGEIECLLRGYDDHYQDLLLNIGEVVLPNAIASVVLNKPKGQLSINVADRRYLRQKLANQPPAQLDIILTDAFSQLCNCLNIAPGPLRQHLTGRFRDFTARLKNALADNHLDGNCLAALFITGKTGKENQVSPAWQFTDGPRLEDELFRAVTDEIRQCRYVSDKMAIIRQEIHSMADLVDVLAASCLFADEYTEVFRSLGNRELALLHLYSAESEKEWTTRFGSFVETLEAARREEVSKLITQIAWLPVINNKGNQIIIGEENNNFV
jgi:hypothetical protein